jgi:hypothetical protein
VNPADPVHPPLPDECAPDLPGDAMASLGDLAHGTSDYARAWSSLFATETQLAGQSAVRLALAALIVPALALGICITVDAFVVVLLMRLLQDWASCIAITLLLDMAALWLLLMAMRRWWRNLSMPRSREALAQLLARLT